MKVQGKSPRGKALASLIVMLGKTPSMLDKSPASTPKAPSAPKLETPEQEESQHDTIEAHEHPSHDALSSEVEPDDGMSVLPEHESDQGDEPSALEEKPGHQAPSDDMDLDSLKHDHEGDCHDKCPVRVGLMKRMGRHHS